MTALPSLDAGTEPTAAQWKTLKPIGAVKTSGELRSSTSTLADDAVLRADYNTNATYRLTALIIHSSNSTADFKFQFVDTGSATLFKCSVLAIISGGAAPVISEGGFGTVFTGEGASADRSMWVTGTLVIGGVSGAVKVQWAQNTSNASSTGMQAGSFIILDQVA